MISHCVEYSIHIPFTLSSYTLAVQHFSMHKVLKATKFFKISSLVVASFTVSCLNHLMFQLSKDHVERKKSFNLML